MELVTEGQAGGKREKSWKEISEDSSLHNAVPTGFHQLLTMYSSPEVNTSFINSWFQDMMHTPLTCALALSEAGSFKSLWLEF